MVCPYRHVADYTELTPDEVARVGELTQRAMRGAARRRGPQGFNIGMNQGTVAGAGIAAHLHQHVVPRWGGDTNFLPVIGGAKSMPEPARHHPRPGSRRLVAVPHRHPHGGRACRDPRLRRRVRERRGCPAAA